MPGPVVPDSRHFSILNKMQRIQEGKAIEMQKRKKRILVFSVDAFVCEDLEKLLQLPNGKKYLAKGCRVTEGMRTIYPSVTYPAHVSMLTGCSAGTHGTGVGVVAIRWMIYSMRRKERDIQRVPYPGRLLPTIRMWTG